MAQSKKKSGQKQAAVKHLLENLMHDTMGEDVMGGKGGHVQTPQADVYETADQILMIVDLPGIKKQDVELYIQDDKIYVEALKREVKAPQNAHYHCIERLFGKFKRVIEIPTTIHSGKVEANMVNGVLVVRLPKIEDRRGIKKKIKIG